MANAAINILGNGTIYDLCTVDGCTDQVAVEREGVGVYKLSGTQGMVPAPDGWGTVTNPLDNITASVTYYAGILTLETRDRAGELIDIGSKVTLHILVENAPPAFMYSESEPEPKAEADDIFAKLKAHADAQLQLLQDLLDIGEGTPEIEASALQWKRYRVALSRALDQPGYPVEVEWPNLPD